MQNALAADVFAVILDTGVSGRIIGVLADHGDETGKIALRASLTNPAIDAAAPASLDLTDDDELVEMELDGNLDGIAVRDIGAFELALQSGPLLVSTTADISDPNDGLTSLREAISFANEISNGLNGDADNDGRAIDTITFSPLLFGETVEVDSELNIRSSIEIDGLSTGVVLSGGTGSHRVFRISDGVGSNLFDVEISGITIRDGGSPTSTGFGAGISNGENLTLRSVTVDSNTSGTSFGGGLAHFSGHLRVIDSTFSGNAAGTNAGGINIASGSATIVNSTFSGNSAGRNGGGLFASNVTLLRNTTFTGNRADADNDFSGSGGGIVGSNITAHNSIIAGNFRGTGTTLDDTNGSFRPESSHNLISEPDSGSTFNNSVGGNIVGNGNGGAIPIGTILDTTLADNGAPTRTHTLIGGSPAINAGDNARAVGLDGTTPLQFDQRGDDRIRGGTVDMGAVELSPTFVVSTTDDIDDGNVTAGNLSIREAVRLANDKPGVDLIAFDPLLFATPQVITLNSSLAPTESLSILGNGASQLTLSGNSSTRLLELGSTTTAAMFTIEDITLDGGAVPRFPAPTPPAHETGGAITLAGGNHRLLLDGVVISNSAANGGGGLTISDGEFLIRNSSFVSNTASFSGSAILSLGDSNGTILNSTFSQNSGSNTIMLQTAANQIASLQIRNVTIADSTGNGIQVFSGTGGQGTVEIGNSIIATSSGPNAAAGGPGVANFISLGNNLSDDGSSLFNSPSDFTNVNPQFIGFS